MFILKYITININTNSLTISSLYDGWYVTNSNATLFHPPLGLGSNCCIITQNLSNLSLSGGRLTLVDRLGNVGVSCGKTG